MLRKVVNAEESEEILRPPFGLRWRHARFVAEFLIDQNATAAYKRAGYRPRGHSAEVNASRLRKSPDVRAVCAAKTREQLARIYGQATARKPIRIRGLPGRW
jgi:phage terminase small subunit